MSRGSRRLIEAAIVSGALVLTPEQEAEARRRLEAKRAGKKVGGPSRNELKRRHKALQREMHGAPGGWKKFSRGDG